MENQEKITGQSGGQRRGGGHSEYQQQRWSNPALLHNRDTTPLRAAVGTVQSGCPKMTVLQECVVWQYNLLIVSCDWHSVPACLTNCGKGPHSPLPGDFLLQPMAPKMLHCKTFLYLLLCNMILCTN